MFIHRIPSFFPHFGEMVRLAKKLLLLWTTKFGYDFLESTLTMHLKYVFYGNYKEYIYFIAITLSGTIKHFVQSYRDYRREKEEKEEAILALEWIVVDSCKIYCVYSSHKSILSSCKWLERVHKLTRSRK